ncbi:MAG: hypothetical protein V3V13_10480 [Paracoccaceae bacterium]
MKYSKIACILPVIAIPACGSTTPDTQSHTDSEFRAATVTGIDHNLSNATTLINILGNNNNGYAFAIGLDANNVYQGFAGVIVNPGLFELPPATGSAIMSGSYHARRIHDITVTNGVPTGIVAGVPNNLISLVVDYGAGTLIGGDIDTLYVDGTFSGTTLSGGAIYYGVDGDLTGIIDPDQAIGAFHGHDDTNVHAGGFIVNTQ